MKENLIKQLHNEPRLEAGEWVRSNSPEAAATGQVFIELLWVPCHSSRHGLVQYCHCRNPVWRIRAGTRLKMPDVSSLDIGVDLNPLRLRPASRTLRS